VSVTTEPRLAVRESKGVIPDTAADLPVVLTPGEDGYFKAECPVIPGCISQGRTRDEALQKIREAIELCLENRTV